MELVLFSGTYWNKSLKIRSIDYANCNDFKLRSLYSIKIILHLFRNRLSFATQTIKMLKSIFRILTAALFLIFFYQTAVCQISNPSGDIKKAPDQLIWAQTLEGSYFNEFWNYQFYFDNGMKAHIVFSVANFGSLKSPVSGVRVSVYDHNGELYQLSREYPIERLVQDKDNHRFQLHPEREVFFEGKLPHQHRIVINTSKDGVHYDIDLSLKNISQAVMLGDGIFNVDSEKIGIVAHIPFAEAAGHVSINNNKKRVTGTAYMDHTFQNQTTTRLMHSGYRFVNHLDQENWDILYFMLPKNSTNNRTIGYRVVKSGNNVSMTGVKRIEQLHRGRAFNTSVPRIVELRLEDDSTLRISRTEDQEKFSILSELGWLARRAARSFLGGEVIDFRGEATLQESSHRPKPGDYNFFLVD